MKEQIINPLLVIFADGWGVYQKYEGNIISKAITTNFNDFITHYPTTTIMPLNGEFSIDKKEALLTVNQVIQRGDKKGSKIHIIMPLLADISNIKEILSLCRKESFYRVYLHLIINSTYSKNETTNLILELNALLNKESFPAIATICGCFYALDQDNYYDRTNKAYETLVLGKGRISNDPIKLLNSGYLKKISNNEFEPSNIIKNGTISNGDCVLFFELTKNEIKQLKESLEQANFTKFKVTEPLKDLYINCINIKKSESYAIKNSDNLSQIIALKNLSQILITETEGYLNAFNFLKNHTYEKHPKETTILIPTKEINNYADDPEMSSNEITNKTIEELDKNQNHLYTISFPNIDSVAHTKDLIATRKAVEVIDVCIGKIVRHALKKDGTVIITSNFGNAEMTIDHRTDSINTNRKQNPVPLIIIGKQFEGKSINKTEALDQDLSIIKPTGTIVNLIETILKLLNIKQIKSTSHESLI